MVAREDYILKMKKSYQEKYDDHIVRMSAERVEK